MASPAIAIFSGYGAKQMKTTSKQKAVQSKLATAAKSCSLKLKRGEVRDFQKCVAAKLSGRK